MIDLLSLATALSSNAAIIEYRATAGQAQAAGGYRDGLYVGTPEDAYYGIVQVQANVQGGQLVSVKVLRFPNDRSTSRYINSQAIPILQQEAIAAQIGQVDVVSGATLTSEAFIQSLANALDQAASTSTSPAA